MGKFNARKEVESIGIKINAEILKACKEISKLASEQYEMIDKLSIENGCCKICGLTSDGNKHAENCKIGLIKEKKRKCVKRLKKQTSWVSKFLHLVRKAKLCRH
jgi:hypothetical protein